jgi:hypothetical protein
MKTPLDAGATVGNSGLTRSIHVETAGIKYRTFWITSICITVKNLSRILSELKNIEIAIQVHKWGSILLN